MFYSRFYTFKHFQNVQVHGDSKREQEKKKERQRRDSPTMSFPNGFGA